MEEIVRKKSFFGRLIGFLRDHLAEFISFLIAFAGLCAYFLWLFAENGRGVPGIAASLVCFALFALGLMLGVPRAIRFFRGEMETAPVELLGERSTTRKRLHPILRIFIMGLVYHFILILAAYFIYTVAFGYNGSVFSTLKTVWIRSDNDAIHYISIAENWYTTEFPQAWAMVFLPLYPLCIRAANLIFGDSFVSGFVLNILFSAGAGVLLYELALCDLGRRSSRFAVFCAFAMPAAVFFLKM